MPHLEIGAIVPCASLMTPLAGIARNRRPEATHAPAVVPTDTPVAARRSGLSTVWRTGTDGTLIMEWKHPSREGYAAPSSGRTRSRRSRKEAL